METSETGGVHAFLRGLTEEWGLGTFSSGAASNLVEIKKAISEIQSTTEALPARVNEAEDSDIEDKMMDM